MNDKWTDSKLNVIAARTANTSTSVSSAVTAMEAHMSEMRDHYEQQATRQTKRILELSMRLSETKVWSSQRVPNRGEE